MSSLGSGPRVTVSASRDVHVGPAGGIQIGRNLPFTVGTGGGSGGGLSPFAITLNGVPVTLGGQIITLGA